MCSGVLAKPSISAALTMETTRANSRFVSSAMRTTSSSSPRWCEMLQQADDLGGGYVGQGLGERGQVRPGAGGDSGSGGTKMR